jgi:CheY-like chemotaxis protein
MVILHADDDQDDVDFFCEIIDAIDPKIVCHTFPNGEQLLSYLEDCIVVPDLIFLDINMPLMDGFECLKQLKTRKETRPIPVIIFTTSGRKVDMDRVKKAGAADYIVKDHDFAESYKLVVKALKPYLP